MLKHKITLIIGGIIVIALATGGIAIASTANSNKTTQNATTSTIDTAKPVVNTSNITKSTSTNTSSVSNTKSIPTNTTKPINNINANTTNTPTNTSVPVTKSTPTSTSDSKNSSALKNTSNTSPNTPTNQPTTSQSNNNPTNTTNKSSNTTSGTIKIVSYSKSQMLGPDSIMVENTTGKPIPDAQLLSVIKNWILNQQYNYNGFADCNGTMWSEPWLNNIPNNQLINYFIEANGKAALSQNITAQELNKTTVDSLSFAREHPNPFSKAQTDIYIKQMLKESYPNQTITNIVFHGSNSQGGDYYVYTKQMGTSRPFWYVQSWIGYPTGV
ncbi:MAG: hypothetical protein ACRC41_15195 [Sarcina sp.]